LPFVNVRGTSLEKVFSFLLGIDTLYRTGNLDENVASYSRLSPTEFLSCLRFISDALSQPELDQMISCVLVRLISLALHNAPGKLVLSPFRLKKEDSFNELQTLLRRPGYVKEAGCLCEREKLSDAHALRLPM